MTLLKGIVVCLVLANVGYFLWARGIAKTAESPAELSENAPSSAMAVEISAALAAV